VVNDALVAAFSDTDGISDRGGKEVAIAPSGNRLIGIDGNTLWPKWLSPKRDVDGKHVCFGERKSIMVPGINNFRDTDWFNNGSYFGYADYGEPVVIIPTSPIENSLIGTAFYEPWDNLNGFGFYSGGEFKDQQSINNKYRLEATKNGDIYLASKEDGGRRLLGKYNDLYPPHENSSDVWFLVSKKGTFENRRLVLVLEDYVPRHVFELSFW